MLGVEGMIQIYVPENTEFHKNGDAVLLPTVCELDTESWALTLDCPRDEDGRWGLIQEGAVLKVPTFMPEDQLFRIESCTRDDDGATATARPIFFDSKNEVMLVDIRPTDKTGQQALDILTEGTKYSGSSDITNLSTAYYQMRNLIEALTGDDDNSFINRWGGEVLYDNYRIIINSKHGSDKGVQLRYGKNIPEDGMSIESNTSDLVTRIYPKAYNGRQMGGPGYVDSPLISKYPIVYQRVLEFEDIRLAEDIVGSEEGIEVCQTQEELDAALLKRCQEQYESGIDKPAVTITCDMVLLSDTVNYADLKDLETVSQGDTIEVINERLGVSLSARVCSLVYDCIRDRVSRVVIGAIPHSYLADTSAAIQSADKAIRKDGTVIGQYVQGVIDGARTMLTAQRQTAADLPVRALFMQDLDPNSATYGATCYGTAGIEFADKRTPDGSDWAWSTALGPKGLIADAVITGLLSDRNGNFYLDMDTGELRMKNGAFSGEVNASSGIVGGWDINEDGLKNDTTEILDTGVTNIYTWADLYIIRLIIEGVIYEDEGIMNHYDLNGDGRISSADYVILKRHLLALPSQKGGMSINAEFNEDGAAADTEH